MLRFTASAVWAAVFVLAAALLAMSSSATSRMLFGMTALLAARTLYGTFR